MKIAMWSGPRNLSTAMMYAFGNRADFAVWDEPFYAPYLAQSGMDHPMRSEIIISHETNPKMVGAICGGTVPDEKPHFYMKHMALHMLPEFPLDWAERCHNVHLLRHPARVVASYAAKREQPTFDDIGFRQQLEICEKLGGWVIDSYDIREQPRAMLARLCNALDLEFDPAMLNWPQGGHRSDGIWASHWYNAIHNSTGFAGPEGPLPELTGHAAELVEQAMPYYEKLVAQKM